MISGLPPLRRFDPAVKAALRAAAGQAKAWAQDYVGAEHLFLGILESEDGEGPGHRVLAELDADPGDVKKTIAEIAGIPSGRTLPDVLPLTARCRRILDWADDIRSRTRAATLDAGHVMQSILTEGGSVPFHTVGFHLKSVPETAEGRPAWVADYWREHVAISGEAWSFPAEAMDEVLGVIQPSLLPWDRRAGTQLIKIRGILHVLEGAVHEADGEILVFVRLKDEAMDWFDKWWGRWFYARRTAALRAVKNGCRLAPAAARRRWPVTEEQFAGSLNRDWFASRPAAGRLRIMQGEDRAFCQGLHEKLEENGQVPTGFMPEFIKWLGEGPDLRYVLEDGGQLLGCCGICLDSIPQVAEALKPDGPPALDMAILTFGLISPDCQGRRLGTTQLAARLVLARRLGCRIARVSATDQSVGWLERLGFHFWQIHHSDSLARGFSGSLLLTDDDAAFLESWLGWEDLETLLPQVPVKEQEPATRLLP